MMANLLPALDALRGLVYAAVLAALPIVIPTLLRRLNMGIAADQAARIEKAAEAGAGLAYQYAAAHEGGLSNVPVRDAALAAGINHVSASVPAALDALGITPEHVSQMVAARLGALLANDPTVTAGTPTPAPAPTLQVVHAADPAAATPTTQAVQAAA